MSRELAIRKKAWFNILKKTFPTKDWTSKLEAYHNMDQGINLLDKAEEADRYLDETNGENEQEAVTVCISCHRMEVAIDANNVPGIPSLNIGTSK